MNSVQTGHYAVMPLEAGGVAQRQDGADRDAWQREMERAQMAVWFQPVLELRSHVTAALPTIFRLQGDAAAAPQAQGAPADTDPVEAAPVRLHTERTEQGLAVWLGLDGDAAGIEQRIAAVLSQLHRTLNDKGQRLGLLVCNGRVVYQSSDQPNRFYNQEA